MKFIADESCDFIIIKELRNAGIDVLSVIEHSPAISDEEVLLLAQKEERIITEDKDFGRLIHLGGDKPLPVLFLRYPFSVRHLIADKLLSFIKKRE